jgi:hypothetical protein
MQNRALASRWFAPFIAQLLTAILVAACTSGSLVNHAFSFDAGQESPEAEVMDYRYGDSKQPTARNPEYLLRQGKSLQGAGIQGEMLRGDFLYVKWRIKDTGQVYEENVDLRHRLPADIRDHRIHFIIKGPQLYVYLVTPERRPKDAQPNGPRPYQYLKTLTIYPGQLSK